MRWALVLGDELPAWPALVGALILGGLSYGTSIVLFIHAMRGLGAARTSALFSTAPIAGIVPSILIFQGSPSWLFMVALPLMVIRALLLVNEEHEHVHEMITHEHAHTHDDGHHEHQHDGEFAKRHSHVHTHDRLVHSLRHMPDLHHRHVHHAES